MPTNTITINMYEKYEHMDKRQIVNALINAEKKETKIRDELNTHIELVKFLKSKLKRVIDAPKEPEYYTLETSPAMQKHRKWVNENPEEAKKIREELEMELAGYNNENNRSTQG